LDLDKIVGELKKERARIDRAIAALEGSAPPAIAKRTNAPAQRPSESRTKKRGGITPQGRKRLSLAMKKRWAERRKKDSQ